MARACRDPARATTVSNVSISAAEGPGPDSSTALNERRVFRSSRASGMRGTPNARAGRVVVRSASRSSFLFEHDFFGKPDSTFPDHALGAVLAQAAADRRLVRRCEEPTGPGAKARRQDQPNGNREYI